ncbi:lycopene cyclase family protein [Corynebacterium xerosis]|uniref:lycopene cyclase family protein n=1 Tax=Corynebacterium xerosis TaxID=1725 RepID=UPI0009E9E257|nr:lycopene cyclase family protein [Corynebacterium xerosis]SQB96256.1 Lycopene beta cyclase [Clostridium paraputrificum]
MSQFGRRSGSPRTRAVVLGLGPAGRIAAHRAAARGWDVMALDPAGGSMPSTVGAWAHQLPAWLPADAVASRFRPSVVTSGGRRRLLDDDYVVLDTAVLSRLGGFDVCRERGMRHADGAVTIRDGDGDGEDFGAWTSSDVVVDAVGAAPGAAVLEARQLAFGHVFREIDVPEHLRVPVLMDFTVPTGTDLPPDRADATGSYPATFSYRLPLGDGTWLIEETILAARASSGADDPRRAELHAHLHRMQSRRLADLGLDPARAIADETVDFPMGPRHLPDDDPRKGHGHFGAVGGWMHPATGYCVGAVLADVDRFLDQLEARADASPPGGRPLAWLRRRGLHVLLGFDADQTREFFDSFLSLPDAAIREYLTGTSTPRTLAVMVALAMPLGRRNPKTLARLLATFADGKPVDG